MLRCKKLTSSLLKLARCVLKQEEEMNLIKDLWGHLKEWSDWGMKDWIKAAIVTIVVLFVIYKMTGAGA